MTAYVSIGIASRSDVLLVPNAALRFKPADIEKAQKKRPAKPSATAKGAARNATAAAARCTSLNGKELRPVSIQVGITDSRNTEVINGDLKAGERVVTGDNPLAPAATERGHEAVLMSEAVIRVAGLSKSYVTAAGLFPALKAST